jgi:hypothetical protein
MPSSPQILMNAIEMYFQPLLNIRDFIGSLIVSLPTT